MTITKVITGNPLVDLEVAPMRISDYMREGSKIRPQGKGEYFGIEGTSCALGAAWEAKYGSNSYPPQNTAEFARQFSVDPEITDFIVVANDHLNYTREEIADWLEAQGQ